MSMDFSYLWNQPIPQMPTVSLPPPQAPQFDMPAWWVGPNVAQQDSNARTQLTYDLGKSAQQTVAANNAAANADFQASQDRFWDWSAQQDKAAAEFHALMANMGNAQPVGTYSPGNARNLSSYSGLPMGGGKDQAYPAGKVEYGGPMPEIPWSDPFTQGSGGAAWGAYQGVGVGGEDIYDWGGTGGFNQPQAPTWQAPSGQSTANDWYTQQLYNPQSNAFKGGQQFPDFKWEDAYPPMPQARPVGAGYDYGGLSANDWKIFSQAVGIDKANEWAKGQGGSGGPTGLSPEGSRINRNIGNELLKDNITWQVLGQNQKRDYPGGGLPNAYDKPTQRYSPQPGGWMGIGDIGMGVGGWGVSGGGAGSKGMEIDEINTPWNDPFDRNPSGG